MRRIKLVLIPVLSFVSLQAFAVKKDAPVSATKSSGSDSSSTPLSLFEWNPADLVQNRVRIASEYIVVDGFAFGIASEFQRVSNDNWRQSTLGLGMTATQYLESQSLKGLFAKGECDVFNTSYDSKDGNGNVIGMNFGLDLGYRFSVFKHVTGAASYGVRRVLPDFFNTSGKPVDKPVADNMPDWDVRLNLSLGVAI